VDLQGLIPLAYLVAAISFVLGLKGLSGPDTAVLGNRIAAAGMLLAVAVTFFDRQFSAYGGLGLGLTAVGIAAGGAIGIAGGRLVQMTAMPQMVALFTGVIAFGKLQGIVTPRAFRYGGQQVVTAGVFAVMSLLAIALVADAAGLLQVPGAAVLAVVTVLALVFGIVLVMPIGGADMPVVISLLNAYTGLAVAAAGFVLGNQLLIVAGTLVGAAGTILTRLMSKAMNRSLGNILFGAFGAAPAGAAAARGDDTRTVREISAEDAAILLSYAQQVVVVPGYGMAVAQAQHAVRELADMLETRGVNVRYAIHPVAGRMPGHMNVLLAEANVSYDKLKDMDEINDDFKNTDVALVIGANDVTNPAARSDTSSPIYGMPILNVDQAQNVVVIKRSMKPGFAGIDNELYLDPKTGMLFGDAKEAVERVITEIKRAA
jgi:NAD(P) transhydrogenase subunit beta